MTIGDIEIIMVSLALFMMEDLMSPPCLYYLGPAYSEIPFKVLTNMPGRSGVINENQEIRCNPTVAQSYSSSHYCTIEDAAS